MGKIAFVFAGQGAQYSGMGQELAEISPAARHVFQTLDAIRPGTSQQCFTGSLKALCETRNTQPCMFAVEMACAAALGEKELHADTVAGFSLGELAALTYANVADLATAFRLVCRRGEVMQAAAEAHPAAMVAVLHLEPATVERLCAQFDQVYPVNYNCPGQIAVAGVTSSLKEFQLAVKEAGGRAVPLRVQGGFHSPLMSAAAETFSRELQSCSFSTPSIPLYSNCSGAPYGTEIKPLLARQIAAPVRWEQIIRHMISSGVDTFLELGPGQTLCGLIRKINAGVRTYSAADKAGLTQIFAEVQSC